MPPDPPPVSKGALPEPLKEGHPSLTDQSRVRALLGVPNSGAVPLVSAASLPMINLPYVNTQMGVATNAPTSWEDELWAESAWEAIDGQSWAVAKPTVPDIRPPLPPQDLSALSSSTQQTSLDNPLPPDVSPSSAQGSQASVEVLSTEPGLSLPSVSTAPQRTSIRIPGSTLPQASSPLPPTRTDVTSVEASDSGRQAPMPYRHTTVSTAESSSAALGGDLTTDAHLPPSPVNESGAVKIGGKPQGTSPDNLSPSPVERVMQIAAVEPTFPNPRPPLPPQDLSPFPSSTQQTDLDNPLPPDVPPSSAQGSQALVEVLSTEPGFSLPSVSTAPQKTSIRIPGSTLPQAASPLPTAKADAIPVEASDSGRQAPMPYRQPTASTAEASPTTVPKSHWGLMPNSRSDAMTTDARPATSGFKVPGVQESVAPVLNYRVALTPEPVLRPMPESVQGRNAAENRYPATRTIAAQLEKLERTVADLSSQIAAQKDFQPPVIPGFPQPSQPQVIIQRSASQPTAPRAFWERSYVSRLYRWSRR